MADSVAPPKCKNCEAVLQGAYCSDCGQAVREVRSPIWEAASIFVQQTFGTDARLWRTLRKLMFFPGALTDEFLEGQRQRSIHPFRLFLIASVLAMLTPDISFGEEFVAPESWAEAAPKDVNFLERYELGKERLQAYVAGREAVEMTPFAAEINQRYLMWCLLITQFALVFVVKAMRPKRLLYDHLIFVMHFACFAYFSDMIFRTFEVRSLVGGIPLLLIQSGYCAFAFRRVYALQWKRLPNGLRFLLDLVQGLIVFAAMAIFLKLATQFAAVLHVMPAAS